MASVTEYLDHYLSVTNNITLRGHLRRTCGASDRSDRISEQLVVDSFIPIYFNFLKRLVSNIKVL